MAAGFNPELHNQRRLQEHLGATLAGLVAGSALALTMAMAGREAYCNDLSGGGVPVLVSRSNS